MSKKRLSKIIFITLFFILSLSIISNVQAFDFDTNEYKPGNVSMEEASPVFTMGEKLFGTLRNVALVVAILSMAIIGVRYIFGSVEQKAEYKATLLPWFIGAILVVMVTGLLGIIENFAQNI